MMDMAELKQKVTEAFRALGGDIVVCGNAERFRDKRIFELMPEVKTVICAARIAESRRARRTTSIRRWPSRIWRRS